MVRLLACFFAVLRDACFPAAGHGRDRPDRVILPGDEPHAALFLKSSAAFAPPSPESMSSPSK